jgi:TRAP-type mannitol/chloroaromatic compound transport system permease large subunit
VELTVLLGGFTLLLLIGVPVAFALGASALATVLYMDLPPVVVFQQLASGMNVFSMLAIPFFIFAGDLMMRGGIADKLVALAAAMVGHLRGRLGAGEHRGRDAVRRRLGLGRRRRQRGRRRDDPADEARGYAPDYAVNLTANAALIDLLIPPSHNMILYVIAAGGAISVADLFTAGIVPGLA